MYFRDGVYDQDYHPDAIRLYQRFLERKYETPENLGRALGRQLDSFEIEPPRELDARFSRDLTYHLDWAEAQEELLADAMFVMREAIDESGLCVP
jgi:beta-galactosidase